MKKILIFSISFIFIISLLTSCTEETPINNTETTSPKIISLTSEKNEILYGGEDPAIITCIAEGGNLEYLWEVDLGDIFPMNNDNSIVRFTGSSCCVGEKIIKCTVSNDKGSATENIIINILEEQKMPEIFLMEANPLTIKNSGESSIISCYAIGGYLHYSWQSDCGTIESMNEESWQIKYTPDSQCTGEQTIKCIVSNTIGSVEKTIKIQVTE